MNHPSDSASLADRLREPSPAGGALLPLVVDLDGTLTPTDTLLEASLQLMRGSLAEALCLPFRLLKGRVAFKQYVCGRARLDPQQLPYNAELIQFLREEKRKGRPLVLATASHRSVAEAVAGHLGLFDEVIATESGRNIKGAEKLRAIRERVGERFVYAGDSRADLPIFRGAEAAVLVGASAGVAAAVRHDRPVEREFRSEPVTAAMWLRALRVHQWLKNLLLFVPVLTAFSFFDIERLWLLSLAFVSFSFAASATYVVNDILDLDSDRAHPRKRDRPFASCAIPLRHGLAAAAVAIAAAVLLGAAVSAGFLAMLAIYLVLTGAYSWALRRHALVDVLMLSILYTVRILAGSVAAGVVTSSWLLAFSVFIFFSLALVKRCTELVSLGREGIDAPPGRGYRVGDLAVLWPLGVGAALCAVVVFGLFASDPLTLARYASPRLLWLVALGLIYWLSRLWIKTSRGEMHDDPVVFAISDPGSRVAVLTMIAATLFARFFSVESVIQF